MHVERERKKNASYQGDYFEFEYKKKVYKKI